MVGETTQDAEDLAFFQVETVTGALHEHVTTAVGSGSDSVQNIVQTAIPCNG